MNNLDKLKSKKYSLEQSLKKYKHKTAEMTNALALTEFLEISRKFIEKQSKVDEEDKETWAPDEHDMLLWDPDQLGKIGMKESDLKTTVKWLKKYEKFLTESMEEEKKSLQETINQLGNLLFNP
jgi:hypothetical protein